MGYTEMALKLVDRESKIFRYLQKSGVAAGRARVLANKLPIMHRPQGFRPALVDLHEVVEKTIDLLQPMVAGSATTVEVVMGEGPAEILAESDQVERLLTNLVMNALDAVQGAGKISILVESRPEGGDGSGHETVLAISDSGLGISEEVKERLFEPFFSTKTGGDTAGLGLFTVRQIADQHGAAIEVDSVAGEGATFRVVFPAVSGDGALVAAEPSAEVSGEVVAGSGAKHILVVDDDRDVRQLLAATLVHASYRVTEAMDGEEALRVFGEDIDSFDLVLTDVRMPRMDGHELAQSVREMCPDQKLLFISGYEEDGKALDREFKADVAFLRKPVTPSAVVESVQVLLSTG
jgi:CheY-like chemotaxis protein